MKKKLLYVVNDYAFLLSHRRYLVEKATEIWTVGVVVPETVTLLGELDLAVRRIPWTLSRKGRNPIVELRAIWELFRILRQERPEVVHAITIKPVIYAGILCRILKISLVASISGMGFTYVSQGWKSGMFRILVNALYRLALRSGRVQVIFQNPTDQQFFLESGIISPRQASLIPGVGVDLHEFRPHPLPETPTFTLPARLLSSKGIVEFVEAARELKREYPMARFILAGALDPGNPHGITEAEVRNWVGEGVVEWPGFRSDMPALYAESSAVVLPSYREGFSKVLMEAAASGRAIITTDVPGCREAVVENKNGILVPARDSKGLIHAMGKILQSPDSFIRMGAASRKIAEERFNRETLTRPVLNLYLGRSHRFLD